MSRICTKLGLRGMIERKYYRSTDMALPLVAPFIEQSKDNEKQPSKKRGYTAYNKSFLGVTEDMGPRA